MLSTALLLAYVHVAVASNNTAPEAPPQACSFNLYQGKTAQCGQGRGHCTTIQTIEGGDPTSCCNSCNNHPGCDFFVFSGLSNECHLKQGDSSWQIDYDSCTLGVKTSPGSQLPVFNDAASLQQSSWGKYMMSLYGEVPPAFNVHGPCYPIHISNFWCFYTDKLQAQGLSLPPSVGRCPTKNAPDGQHYDENNAYSSKDLTWLWHSSGQCYSGYYSNYPSPVEVSHEKDPFGDEHYGMWFQYAKGSGVYITIGKTKIFNDHEDAFAFFGAKDQKHPKLDINEDMSRKAAAAGYDTVQFIKHRDDVNYPCAKQMGVRWMNMEIVAVKLTGTYSCGQAQGTPSQLRAGWQGSKPCNCDPNNPNTNCVWSLAKTTGVEYV